MNYEKIYNQLILKRQQIKLSKNECYCENHHIIPKSLGGMDTDDNMVLLTAKEHFVAHLLLVKIMKERYGIDSQQYTSCVRAVTYFKTCSTNSKLNGRSSIRFTSTVYQNIRVEYNRIYRLSIVGRYVGDKNPMYGRKRTEEECRKIRETRKKRGCGIGEKNPMYGKPCYYKMTDEQYNNWKSKIKETCKKRNFKHIYNEKTHENKLVPQEQLEEYLKNGYKCGQYNENRRSTKGMKKVCLPVKSPKQIWIRPEELEDYLKKGYILWTNRLK